MDESAAGGILMNTNRRAAALAIAKHELELRRRRNQILGQDLFGEPAWDMLLGLFVAEGEDRPMSVPTICSSAGVPKSTALRWLITLERRGAVVRDTADDERASVSLSRSERDRLTGFLAQEL